MVGLLEKSRWKAQTLILCCLWISACSRSGPGPAIQGELAPEFSFTNQEGQQHRLSDFRGKVVLVNFWATWCPPCRDELPSLQRLNQQMAGRPFVLVTLSVDSSWDAINRYRQASKLDVPTYADFDKKISSLYGTLMYPETYLIDKKGKVAYKVVGATDWISADMVKFLEVLLSE